MLRHRERRIKLNRTSVAEMVLLISGDNSKAAEVCRMLLQKTDLIDPYLNANKAWGLIALDGHRIYEARIWAFFNDVCGRDLVKMLAILRAHQLGVGVSSETLKYAIDNQGEGLDVDRAVREVRQRLPRFAAAVA